MKSEILPGLDRPGKMPWLDAYNVLQSNSPTRLRGSPFTRGVWAAQCFKRLV